jgi:hypothetical protein
MNFLRKYITPKSSSFINPALLWDFGNIEPDYAKSKKIIIWRVVEYGTLEDWNAIINIYGEENIVMTIKQLSGLSQRSLNFVCKLFDLKKSDFTCYTKPRWRKAHWI